MPFKSLLDPSFTYRNAANTDVRLTFERVKREQEALRQRDREPAKVVAIIGKPLQSQKARSKSSRH
jgi:hypothetical protein